jgi:hypothetical protein
MCFFNCGEFAIIERVDNQGGSCVVCLTQQGGFLAIKFVIGECALVAEVLELA